MKKTRKILSVVFVTCILMSITLSSGIAYADFLQEEDDENLINHLIEEEVWEGTCTVCGDATDALCYRYYSVFSASRTHKYAGGTCTVSTYTGRIHFFCYSCMNVPYYIDGHQCYSIHYGCGAGVTDICRWYVG